MAEESRGILGRIWDGIRTAFHSLPRTIVWSVGILAASSAVAHFGGPDLLGADGLYNTTGGIGGRIISSLGIGAAISFGIGALMGCPEDKKCTDAPKLPSAPVLGHAQAPSLEHQVEVPSFIPGQPTPQAARKV